MKTTLFAIFISIGLLSCKQEKKEKTYLARTLDATESFNEFPKVKEEILTIQKADSAGKEQFTVQFKDTTIAIQNNQKPLSSKFGRATFINTQSTAVLVQAVGEPSLVPSFYIISLKDGKPEVISLDRASKGAEDRKYTKGLEEQGRTSYLINNDFFISLVNGKVYSVKRQNEEERIQGSFLMNSPDKSTLVFLLPSSLYQVNYLTGETFNQPISEKLTADESSVYKQVQQNYSWVKNAKGTSFLKENPDDNRIVDIKEFKH